MRSALRAERLPRLTLLERTFDALPVDEDVATSYGELAAAVGTSGRRARLRVMDLLIAATAYTHATLADPRQHVGPSVRTRVVG